MVRLHRLAAGLARGRVSSFGELVDEARRGTMPRRRFLAAALALGVTLPEAKHAYSAPRLVQVPRGRLARLTLPADIQGFGGEFSGAIERAYVETLAGVTIPMRLLPGSRLFVVEAPQDELVDAKFVAEAKATMAVERFNLMITIGDE